MVAKFLMKYPVLMIGILMMSIFIWDLNRKGHFDNYRENLTPSSCRAALVKLERRIPANWSSSCKDKNLIIVIQDEKGEALKKSNINNYKPYLYRELANALNLVSKQSPSDNMEHIPWVKISLISSSDQIDAVCEGKFISKLSTIQNESLIAEHIHNTVKIKELIK